MQNIVNKLVNFIQILKLLMILAVGYFEND